MDTIGKRIRNKREDLGLSQYDLALKLGYKSRSSVNKIEMDSRNLTQSKIKAIADALETTPSYIMGWDKTEPQEFSSLPIIGSVAAGVPLEEAQDIDGYVEIAGDSSNKFALRVYGESMYPELHDADTVIIKRQNGYKNGDIIVARVNGYEYTVKKYRKSDDKVMLIPINSDFDVMVYDESIVAIEGKVIEVRRQYV